MGYSPWGRKEPDTPERRTLSLSAEVKLELGRHEGGPPRLHPHRSSQAQQEERKDLAFRLATAATKAGKEKLPWHQPPPASPTIRETAPRPGSPTRCSDGPVQPASHSPSPGLLRLACRLPQFASLELWFVCDSRINSCWLARELIIPTPRPQDCRPPGGSQCLKFKRCITHSGGGGRQPVENHSASLSHGLPWCQRLPRPGQ